MEATIQAPQVQTIISSVLTLDEVAEYLRLPIEAVRGHAIQGLLPGNEIKGEWRFLKSAIDRWLAPFQMPLMPQGYITIEDIEAAQARVPEVLALLDRWTTPDQEDYQTETWNQLDQNLSRHTQPANPTTSDQTESHLREQDGLLVLDTESLNHINFNRLIDESR